MIPRHARLFLGALAILLGLSTSASAQDYANRYPLRIYGGLWLGFRGTWDNDLKGPFGVGATGNDDLITTVGGQFGVDYVLMRFFALGGELRVGGVNTKTYDDANFDRSKLVDIDLKPRLRFAPRHLPFEVYGTVPFGMTIPKLSNDLQNLANLDEHVGWNIGVGGGVSVFPLPHFGLNVEPLWLFHKFKVDGPLSTSDRVSLRQFALLLNLVLAL